MRSSIIQDSQTSNSLVSNFSRTMIQEDEISNFFCSWSTHTLSVWPRFRRIAKWTSLHHMLVKVINPSRNVQVSCSLLELCGRHVVMLLMKVLQVANIQHLADNFLESFHHLNFCPNSRHLLFAHARFLKHLFPLWQKDRARLEVFSYSYWCGNCAHCRRVTLQRGWMFHQRFIIFIFLTVVQSGRTRGLSSVSSSSFWTRAGYGDFRFVGRADSSRDFCWYARLVKPNTVSPTVENSTGEEHKPEAGHLPFHRKLLQSVLFWYVN